MNPGWLRKLSTVITHVNYTKMVAHIDPQRGFLHNVNGMMSKHCAALECMRGEKGRGGFGLSVGSRLFFFFCSFHTAENKFITRLTEFLSFVEGFFFIYILYIDTFQLKAQCASFSGLWWLERVLQEMFVPVFCHT